MYNVSLTHTLAIKDNAKNIQEDLFEGSERRHNANPRSGHHARRRVDLIM